MRFVMAVLRIIGILAGAFLCLLGAIGYSTGTGKVYAIVFFIIGVVLLALSLLRGQTAKAEPRPRKSKAKPIDVPPVLMGTARELFGDDRLTPDSWVVLDVETTGLQAQTDRVIEIAMRKYEDGIPGEAFTSLVNPSMPLPEKIVQLTGIKDRDLRKAPRFPEIAWQADRFIDGLPIVAHNARFDVEFLLSEWARAGLTRDVKYIDTVKLAREAFPDMKNYKLATLIDRLRLLDHAQEHRALSDVDAAGRLYLMCRQQIAAMEARRKRASRK